MSIRSMTGFGRASASLEGASIEGGHIEVEIKSVNNRFLDILPKFPSCYSAIEQKILSLLKGKLGRGRVDVYINRIVQSGESTVLQLNRELFKNYLAITDSAFRLAGESLSGNRAEQIISILGRRDIISSESKTVDSEKEEGVLLEVVNEALKELIYMREVEGETLAKELTRQLKELKRLRKAIAKLAKSSPKQFKARLEERVGKLTKGIELSEERLALEVAVLVDKVDVTEELVRLESHIEQFSSISEEDRAGRKLDFITQEMNREVNTIGSKCQNAEISSLVVEAKAIVEKLREQVQNIE